MTLPPGGPRFDDEFWSKVNLRAARVRERTAQELVRAERTLLTGESGSPVFTAAFWREVDGRTRRVRRRALQDAARAEENLLSDQEAQPAFNSFGAHGARRALRPAGLLKEATRSIRRLGSAIPQHRYPAWGFALGLLVTLLVLPQIFPVGSWARMDRQKPLQVILGAFEPRRQADGGKATAGSQPATGGREGAGSSNAGIPRSAAGPDSPSAKARGARTGASNPGVPAAGKNAEQKPAADPGAASRQGRSGDSASTGPAGTQSAPSGSSSEGRNGSSGNGASTSALPCNQAGSGSPTHIQVTNLRQTPISIYQVSTTCEEVFRAGLSGNGDQYSGSTFTGDLWRVRDARNGTLIGDYTAGGADPTVVTIELTGGSPAP